MWRAKETGVIPGVARILAAAPDAIGATLLYKVNASTLARMRGRLVLNGATEIRGSFGESSAAHVSLATAIWLQTMVPLTSGDTVELQGYFRAHDGYFVADHTSFWAAKID